MQDYPLQEECVFLIDETIAPYFILYQEQKENCVPECVQTALANNTFEDLRMDGKLPSYYYNSSLVEDIFYDEGIDYYFCNNFTGTASPLDDETGDFDINFHDKYVLYLSTSRKASLCETQYPSLKEIIAEFKEQLGEYLPTNFDWKKHLYSLNGTYFC